MNRSALVASVGTVAVCASLVLPGSGHAAAQRGTVGAGKVPTTSGYEVNSIVQVPHSSDLFALLSSGSPANYKYRLMERVGHKWHKLKVPSRGGRYGSFSSLGAGSTKTVYLSGGEQTDGIQETPALWHWTGHAFKRVALPPLSDGAESAGQISFSSPTNAWVSGGIWDANDVQSALHLVGTKWTAVEHPPDTEIDEGLISVATISPTFAWAVNGDSSVQFWNGTAWQAGPAVPTGVQPFAVAGDKQGAYVVGDPPYGTPGGPVILKWSGTAWVQQKLPKLPKATSMEQIGISGKSVWALGSHDPGNYIEEPVILHSSGGSWKRQTIKGVSKHLPTDALSVASSKRAYFGGETFVPQETDTHSFLAEYSGAKWKEVASK